MSLFDWDLSVYKPDYKQLYVEAAAGTALNVRYPPSTRGGTGGRTYIDLSHLPTKFSSTELFPALWPPTTAICGRSMSEFCPMDEKASCIRLTSGIRSSIPRFPIAAIGRLIGIYQSNPMHKPNPPPKKI